MIYSNLNNSKEIIMQLTYNADNCKIHLGCIFLWGKKPVKCELMHTNLFLFPVASVASAVS